MNARSCAWSGLNGVGEPRRLDEPSNMRVYQIVYIAISSFRYVRYAAKARLSAEVAWKKPVHPLPSPRTPVRLGSAETELDRSLQVLGLNQLGVLVVCQRIENSRHEAPRIHGVRLHVAHHHLDRDVCSRFMPAIVVRRHADHLVGDLGLAGKFRFRETRHVDDTAAPGPVEVTLRAR